jgi:hypothetical protein
MKIEPPQFEIHETVIERFEFDQEAAVNAWMLIESGLSEFDSAGELGFPVEHFYKLFSHEFTKKLAGGESYRDFPNLSSTLEDHCWKTICNSSRFELRETIKTPLCIQLRLKMTHLFKDGASLNEIAKRFEINLSQVKALVMLSLAEEGLTLNEIGAQFHLTRERARQIIAELGISVRTIRQQSSKEKVNSRATLNASVASWINEHPGCHLFEITSALNIDEAEVRNLCPQDFRRLVIGGKSIRDSQKSIKFSREQIIKALQEAYEFRNPSKSMYAMDETQPLTGPFYEELRIKKIVFGPSQARILQIFGTWKAACQEARVPFIEALRDEYELRWTDEELVGQLADHIMTVDSPSVESFDHWCRLDDSRSSSGTIRNQIGPWSVSYELALLKLRRMWTND